MSAGPHRPAQGRPAGPHSAAIVAGYHRLLAFLSALICVGVMAGFLWRPMTWPGISQHEFGPLFQLVIGLGFGSVAALGAAFVSLGIAVTAVRDRSPRNGSQPAF